MVRFGVYKMATYNQTQIQNLLRQAGWRDVNVSSKSGNVPLIALMSAISIAESSGKTDIIGTIARGREYSVGLFQINTLVHKNYSVDELKDPLINTKEALRIYNAQGLNAWGAYYDNRYKRYLPEALNVYSSGRGEQAFTNDSPKSNSDINTILLIGGLGLLALIVLWR